MKWWRQRVKADPTAKERAKLELFALCMNADVPNTVEHKAQELVQTWLRKHRTAIAKLDEGSRVGYDEVQNAAAHPELTPLTFPSMILDERGDDEWKKHLYVDSEGAFHAKLNQPETETLARELKSKTAVAWLRNTPRTSRSLCVPYEVDGEDRPMYPDFLLIRKEADSLVVDVIDPHSVGLADAAPKAAGLAKFADRHGAAFGRILLILLDGTRAKTLDLVDETDREKVRGVKLPDQLRNLFK